MESIYSFISKSFMVVVPLTLCAALQGQYNQSAKLVSPDRESRAEFGTAVSINKDYAVIGASRENIAAGAAYIYKKNSNGNWVTSQKIVPSDGEFMAEFGGSMKLGNDFLVISAGRADINGEERAGALYVYNLNNNVWNFSQKLTSTDYVTNGMLGVNPTAVDVYGNTIIAGSPGRSDWTGAAYIFEKVNNSWQQTQKINNPENIEYGTFGVGVAIHKDYLVVGASDVNEATGAAYIFKKNTSGEWNYLQKITASDPKKKSYFGNSVSIIDKEIVVGAYAEGSVGGNIAAAYIYKLDDNGVWKQTQKIASPISQENTYFGWMTKITSDRLYITSPHLYGLEATNIYIYEKDNAGQ